MLCKDCLIIETQSTTPKLITAHPKSEKTVIEEHDRIILLKDLPEDGLQAGNIGTVVYIHSQGEVFEVEFMTLDGGTVAVVTLLSSQIRAVSKRDITHVRELAVS